MSQIFLSQLYKIEDSRELRAMSHFSLWMDNWDLSLQACDFRSVLSSLQTSSSVSLKQESQSLSYEIIGRMT